MLVKSFYDRFSNYISFCRRCSFFAQISEFQNVVFSIKDIFAQKNELCWLNFIDSSFCRSYF